MVYSICLLELKNPKDAEDIAQEVFIKYMKKEVVFENQNHEKAFFITVARNLSRDQYKSFWKKWRHNKPIEDIQLISNERNEEIFDLKLDLRKVIISLDSKYSLPLYLYYYHGYSVNEISKILDINESTVQTRLDRARKQIKIKLGGRYNE